MKVRSPTLTLPPLVEAWQDIERVEGFQELQVGRLKVLNITFNLLKSNLQPFTNLLALPRCINLLTCNGMSEAVFMIEQQSPVLIFKDLVSIAAQPDELPWEPFRPGVDIYRFYKDGEAGAAAALLRYQPGASIPRHIHTGFEHIFVLSGSQTDHNGEHKMGTLVINPPGTNHSVESVAGCIVLVIWEKPVCVSGQ